MGLPGFFFCFFFFAIADTFPLLPSCTCAERAGKVNDAPCSCCTKKYSIQEFSSSVVCAACLHICKTYRTVWRVRQFVYSSLSCLCLRFLFVCFFFFFFPIQTPSACFLFIPFRVKSWQQRRCGHWQCAEWKTELCRSPSILL